MKVLLILLAVTTVVLLLPYKKIRFLKNALSALTVAFIVGWAVQAILPSLFPVWQATPVTITAKGETVVPAEGSEIWIKGITVDGRTYSPKNIFSGNWIEKGGSLGWRSYGPDNIPKAIQGTLPAGKNRTIMFETNKWRGIATISVGGKDAEINCYTNSEQSSETAYQAVAVKAAGKSFVTPQIQQYTFVCTLLLVFLLILYLFYRDTKKDVPPQTGGSQPQQRMIWMDALKIISCFAIVVIHLTATDYGTFHSNIYSWYNILYLNSLVRFAVPCFLFISGLLILLKNNSLKTILSKRVPRLLIPLIFWSICYILINIFVWKKDQSFWQEILTIPFEEKSGHLWYIYQLIELYLIAPFLCLLDRSLNKKMKQYFIFITLLLPGFADMVARLCGFCVQDYMGLNWLKIGLAEIGICLLGKYAFDEYRNKPINKWVAPIGMFTSYGLLVVSTYYVSVKNKSPYYNFFDQVRLPTVLFGLFTFLLFYSLKDKFDNLSELKKKIIIKLSNLTMGVYFLHMIVVDTVGDKSVGLLRVTPWGNSVPTILLSAAVYFIISVMVCYVLSSIPYLKKLVA